MNKREKQINILVSNSEFELIKKTALKLDLKVSNYVRILLLKELKLIK